MSTAFQHYVSSEAIYYNHPIQVRNDDLSMLIEMIHPVVKDADWQFNKGCELRIYGDYELIYILDGEMTVSIDKLTYVVGANSIIFIKKYSLAQIFENQKNPHNNYWLHFDVSSDYMGLCLSHFFEEPVLKLPYKNNQLITFFRQIDSEHYIGGSGSFEAIQCWFKLILTHLLRLMYPEPAILSANIENVTTAITSKQKDLLNSCVTLVNSKRGAVSVEEVCETLYTSPATLRRIFQKSLNMSPLDYIRTVRMYNAELLLCNSSLTVTAIADNLGFSSEQHFSNEFRQFHNVSPKQFRNRI